MDIAKKKKAYALATLAPTAHSLLRAPHIAHLLLPARAHLFCQKRTGRTRSTIPLPYQPEPLIRHIRTCNHHFFMTRMWYMWMPTRRGWPCTRIHTPQPRPTLYWRLQHRPATNTDEFFKHPSRTDVARAFVVGAWTEVISTREDASAGEFAVVKRSNGWVELEQELGL